MVEVKIPLRAFNTKSFYFNNGDKGDQVLISPPVYNKELAGEGYDKLLVGKVELHDQELVFYQDSEDSPILLRELVVAVKGFNLVFIDLVFKSHEDGRMYRSLINALMQKHKASKG
jgi:hypothetical protein